MSLEATPHILNLKRKRTQSPHSQNFGSSAGSSEKPSSRKSRRTLSSPRTPESPNPTLPLTRANLALLESPSAGRMPAKSLSSSVSAEHPDIAGERRRLLERHGLYWNDQHLYQSHTNVVEKVEGILLSQRHSTMKDASAQKIKDTIDKFYTLGEATAFHKVWNLVFKDHRDKKRENDLWLPEEWETDGLIVIEDTLFLEKTFTKLDLSSAEFKHLANLIPRLKDPKPDLCFGIDKCHLSYEELEIIGLIQDCCSVQSGSYFAFMAVEYKGKGDMAECEDQAARSGSTLVQASRKFHEKAGQLDPTQLGADSDNVIFSICMAPHEAIIYAHWALVKGPTEIDFHMTRVREFHMLKKNDLVDFRRDLDRIVDWGLLERKNDMRAMLPDVKPHLLQEIEKEKAEKAAAKSTTSGASSSKASSGKGSRGGRASS
ncbi:MAG: hypothetical protein Q9222_004463 [Ikaeria aurantiellina]